MTEKSQTPLYDTLAARVLRLCPRRTFTKSGRVAVDLMPLARWMGRDNDRQLRQWLIQRMVVPQGEPALLMQRWCEEQERKTSPDIGNISSTESSEPR